MNISSDQIAHWLIEQSGIGVIWLDKEGKITFSNRPAEGLFRASLRGRSLLEFAHTDGLLERLQRALGGEGVVEFQIRTDDGDHPIEARVTSCPVGIALVVTDPSKEQELIDELMHLASWPEFNPSPMVEFGVEALDLRYANASGEALADSVREVVRTLDLAGLGEKAELTVHHGERVFQGVIHAIPEWACVRVFLHDDTAKARALALLDENRTQLEKRVLERTAELAHEVEVRRRAERQAVDASRAKSVFLASMSHELRTPLNAILGYSEMLLEHETNVENRKDLGRVISAGTHLLSLISDILDLAKIEAGKLELALEPTDLNALLEGVLDTIRPLARAKKVALASDLQVLPLANTDGTRVRQVLLNLVGNACKFTKSGEVHLSARLAQGGSVRIEVRDTGVGIAPENLKRVFEPFQQEHTTTNREFGGTGLGLAICLEIATLLGGRLSVESAVGVGSTFTLEVPIRS